MTRGRADARDDHAFRFSAADGGLTGLGPEWAEAVVKVARAAP